MAKSENPPSSEMTMQEALAEIVRLRAERNRLHGELNDLLGWFYNNTIKDNRGRFYPLCNRVPNMVESYIRKMDLRWHTSLHYVKLHPECDNKEE